MNRPQHPAASSTPPTIQMSEGWHCLHIYYKVNQAAWTQIAQAERTQGREDLIQLLDPAREGAPARMISSAVSGHRADLGLMLMDVDPLVIDGVVQAVRASGLGPALEPTYSFVSITEVSEYVPTVEQYGAKLAASGTEPGTPAYDAKLNAYGQRLPAMNRQRLYPEIPHFPVMTFYPMNKSRVPGANWYVEPFSVRSELMSEHATSGIKFAGRVSQLITAATGFDDWEWGVTLWASAPEHIKEIVYTMRFDKASAKYAEFGPFYISYIDEPAAILQHLKV